MENGDSALNIWGARVKSVQAWLHSSNNFRLFCPTLLLPLQRQAVCCTSSASVRNVEKRRAQTNQALQCATCTREQRTIARTNYLHMYRFCWSRTCATNGVRKFWAYLFEQQYLLRFVLLNYIRIKVSIYMCKDDLMYGCKLRGWDEKRRDQNKDCALACCGLLF